MEHCDFVPLRNMLIRTHLQDLKEVTNNVHYENYRCRKLAGVAGGTVEKIPNKVRKNSDVPLSLIDIAFIISLVLIILFCPSYCRILWLRLKKKEKSIRQKWPKWNEKWRKFLKEK